MTDTATNTPATTDSEPLTAKDWQAVIDILDNPFIKPSEREQALYEQGLRLVRLASVSDC